MKKAAAPLHLVDLAQQLDQVIPSGQALEEHLQLCVERRAWLRRELAAEDRRLDYLRRLLASERRTAFIRREAIEREFGQ